MDPQIEYSKDPRIPCHYGRKCYQKNPNHHQKYKHPPDPKRKNQHRINNGNVKRPKLNDIDTKKKDDSEQTHNEGNDSNLSTVTNEEPSKNPEVFSNDVSDSDSENESDPNKKDQHRINNDNVERHKLNDIDTKKNVDLEQTDDENHIEISPGNYEGPSKKSVITNDVSDSDSESESKDLGTLTEEKTVQENTISSSHQAEIVNKNTTYPKVKEIKSVCNHENGHNNEDSKEYIKSKFLFEMPSDFYEFYVLCERLNANNPSEALSSIGLKLVGPFDVLSGKFCGAEISNDDYLIHWRYYRDPPNFQTVLKGDDRTGYHIGYFRDNPDGKPVFLAENCAVKDGILTPIGENIFGAVSTYIEDKKKTCDPFSKMRFEKIQIAVKKEAEKLGYDIARKTKAMTKRNNKVLSRTFNKVGLVVPYERKTQLGYRKLAMSETKLDSLLTKIDKAKPEEKSKFLGELQSEILTWTDIASDECDFGTGIELGWDILCHGVDLNHTTARLLASNFRQLKWEAFAKIAEAHMANRRKGSSLSII